jgi:beta-glucosidase-like glycosyl hydrolase
MVGHLSVPGLTEQGVPATLSPSAYRYLRERAGVDRLLMTDSLSMEAISFGMRLTPAQAAVGRCPPAWCWSTRDLVPDPWSMRWPRR